MPRGFLRNINSRRGTFATVLILGFIIPVIFLSYYAFGQNAKPTTTLLLVSVLFRHGDRTPTETYPNDPYKDAKFWPQGWGALTNLGKMQIYKLGIFLRKRYSQFLNDLYSSEDVYVVSSDHDRCLMSAQLCLAGLFPPVGDQIWNEQINWQPIPVHTTPRHLDQLIVVKKPCRVYEKEFNNSYKSPYFKRINQENEQLYQYLTEKSGRQVNSVLDVELIYNTLEIQKMNNFKLPDWTDSVFPSKMKNLAAQCLAMFTHTETMKRLKGGPIVAEVAQHMAHKILGSLKPNRNLYLYSGHDLTIVSVLRALGFQELIKPNNGAALIFELRRPNDNSDHLVEILYLNDTNQQEPHPMKIPGCGDPCKLKTWLQITKPVTPENWDKECDND